MFYEHIITNGTLYVFFLINSFAVYYCGVKGTDEKKTINRISSDKLRFDCINKIFVWTS